MLISLQDFEGSKMEASYTNFKISGNKLISKTSGRNLLCMYGQRIGTFFPCKSAF